MRKTDRLRHTSPAFRLMIATSWLAPDARRQDQEERIREAVDAGPDWTEYLHLVDRHRTPALSWAALSRTPEITVPELTKRELQKRSDACRMQAIQHCIHLADVLKRFNRAGIPVMPLKGQILSLKIYGDVGLRQTQDMDLEVAGGDFRRAQACLESGGWRLESSFSPMSPRQWESFLRFEHSIDFIHPSTGCMVELHWHNQWETPEAAGARWARSIRSEWQGCSIQAMNPGDLTLYLCAHGGHHAWFRAKWLGDLARAHSLGLLDWEAAWDEARRSGQERVLEAGRCLLDRLYGLSVPNLRGSGWIGCTLPLVEMPLQALEERRELAQRAGPAKLRNSIRTSRYQRVLWPQKTWRYSLSRLFYNREDFNVLPLPDRLFWAYKALRPVLWLWRWARRAGRPIPA